jgi:hypothetical protein
MDMMCHTVKKAAMCGTPTVIGPTFTNIILTVPAV